MNPAVIQPLPGIGDMIWHLSHIRAIAAHLGQPITLIAKPRSAADQIFAADPAVKDVVWLDRNPDNRRGAHDGGAGFLRVAAAWRARHFDRVYLLHHSKSLALLVRLAGIPARFGYGAGPQRLLLNRRPFLTPQSLRKNPFDQATDWLAAAGIPLLETEPRLAIADTSLQEVRFRLGDRVGKPVMIGIGTSEPYKQWGAERFAALVRGLLGQGHRAPVIVGGRGEAGLANEIAALLPEGAVSLAIGWTLSEVAALFSLAAFYVGNYTGVMNIAAAVDIPTFGLFGATSPLTHTSRIVPILPPGGLSKMDGMVRITPDAVLAAVASVVSPR